VRRRRHEEPHPSHERWLVSYADFVTLLFAFFVSLYAISVVDKGKAQSLVESLRKSFRDTAHSGDLVIDHGERPALPSDGSAPSEQMRLDLLGDRIREIQQQPGFENGLRVRSTEEGLVISLADSLFFKPGGAEIPPEVEPVLREVARLLSEIPNHVRVEGHTDEKPIVTTQFPSNWHLSAIRAVEIVRYFESVGIQRFRLSASGFAAERPLVSNETEEGRQINRRVDCVVLRSRLAQK